MLSRGGGGIALLLMCPVVGSTNSDKLWLTKNAKYKRYQYKIHFEGQIVGSYLNY